jgi:GNAT superfamily N-acetyltransferase
VLALAARHGLAHVHTLPLLGREAADPVGHPSAATVDGTRVREITGSEHEVFARGLELGFGMPQETALAFAQPALLDGPGMTAFTLDLDGETVATGFNVVVGDHVGLFNGSVPPEHRRRGYYRALVGARLRHAAASGARYAFTQTTPMSRPLYEALGFRLVETWTYLTAHG